MRIEVDEMGRHILILDEDIVEDFALDEGDKIDWEIFEGSVILNFGS